MKKTITALLAIILALSLCACSNGGGATDKADTTAAEVSETVSEGTTLPEGDLTLFVNDKTFSVALERNSTSNVFCYMLPVTFSMNDYGGIEKYHYLDANIPGEPQTVDAKKGDIMLYEDNCIVIFYEDAGEQEGYTVLGHILNTDTLEDALGSGDTEVSIKLQEK